MITYPNIQDLQMSVQRLSYMAKLDTMVLLRTGDYPSPELRAYWKAALAVPSDEAYLALVEELDARLSTPVTPTPAPVTEAPVVVNEPSLADQIQALSRVLDLVKIPSVALDDLAKAYANKLLNIQQIETFRDTLAQHAGATPALADRIANVVHSWSSLGMPIRDAITYADELGTIPASIWPAMPEFLATAVGKTSENPLTLIGFGKNVAALAQIDIGTVADAVKLINAGQVNAAPMGALLQQIFDLLPDTTQAGGATAGTELPFARQFLYDTLQRTMTDSTTPNNWKLAGMAYAIACLDTLGYTVKQLSQPEMVNAFVEFLAAINSAESFMNGLKVLDALMGEHKQLVQDQPATVSAQSNPQFSNLEISFSEPVRLSAIDADGNGIPDDMAKFAEQLAIHGKVPVETGEGSQYKEVLGTVVSAYVDESHWLINLAWDNQPVSASLSLGGIQDATGDAVAAHLLPIALIGTPPVDPIAV